MTSKLIEPVATKTVYAVQHDPLTRIGVTYEPGNEGGKGLVVSVYRTVDGEIQPPQRFRYWNPAEVTKWFENNSKASVKGWRQSYHTSGLGADDFERPGGESRDVEIVVPYRAVPYHSQRDNERYPNGTCNVTSCAMAMAFFGKKPIETKYTQIEDNLEYYMTKRRMDRHLHAHLEQTMRAHGLDARFLTGRTLDDIRDYLRAGALAIVSGQFTSSGHIVCCIGVKNGRDFIVHDPWGSFNTNYKDHNGAAVIYSQETMQRVLIDKRKGRNPAWVHIVKG